jgi:hypothetical protein
MMRNCAIFLVLLLAFSVLCSAQSASQPGSWAQWNFLLGEWVGEGNGEPGQGTGGSSFSFDLQGRVLVRRSFAVYPGSKDRSVYRHDDLMIIYLDPADQKTRAVFFDNEGHVIRYDANVSSDGSTFQFVSEPAPAAPRYRFTYVKAGADRLRFQFEIAPTERPEKFATYIQGAMYRKARVPN